MDFTLRILKALADKNRLRVVLALEKAGEMCACQITELLQVRGATVSRHCNLLVNAGLLKSRKEGRWMFYSVDPQVYTRHRELFDWLHQQVASCPDLRADQEKLADILAREPEDICRQQRGERCCPPNKKEGADA